MSAAEPSAARHSRLREPGNLAEPSPALREPGAPSPALRARLREWERYGRPGLPDRGFVLSRPDGSTPEVLLRCADGAQIFTSAERIIRMSPSPDRSLIALELAPSGHERNTPALLVVATGQVHRFPEVHCRYDPVRWNAESTAYEFYASGSRRWVRVVAASASAILGSPGPEPARRLRLFPGGPAGLVVESGPGTATTVSARSVAQARIELPGIVTVVPTGEPEHRSAPVIVHHAHGVRALDPIHCSVLWRWEDPEVRVTAIAARGETVMILGARAGHSVVVELRSGEYHGEMVVQLAGQSAAATGIAPPTDPHPATAPSGPAGESFLVRVEGPACPPHILTVGQLRAAAPMIGVPRTPPHPDTLAVPAVPTGELLYTRRLTVPVSARNSGAAPKTAVAPSGASSETSATDSAATASPGERSVHLILTTRRDQRGPVPLILTCYGGFGVPALPEFEPTIPAWVLGGAAYATAQVRGGGEHGQRGRAGGYGRDKAGAIADLTAAAHGLIAAGITTPAQLVLAGASHGGTIVAACALLSPELCAGVVSTAAPLDLHRLSEHPLGAGWESEFPPAGTPERDALSPLAIAERLAAGHDAGSAAAIPAFLGITLAEDSRVAPADTRRMIAALHRAGGRAHRWNAPDTGHGANSPESVHRLAAAILGFAEATIAAAATAPPAPHSPRSTPTASKARNPV